MKKTFFILAVLAALAGCSTLNQTVEQGIKSTGDLSREKFAAPPVQVAVPVKDDRVIESKGAFLPVMMKSGVRSGEWLRKIPIRSIDLRTPTPLPALISLFNSQGVNIVADLPLSGFIFTGQVNATNAESALRIVLSSLGLDYQVDDAAKIVSIRPMATRSWNLNIGNRKSYYTSDTGTGNGGGSSSTTSGTNGSSNGTGGGLSVGALIGTGSSTGGASSTGTTTGTSSNSGSSGTREGSSSKGVVVVAGDDFWTTLGSELRARLNVMVPRAMLNTQATGPGPQVQVPSVGTLTQPSAQNSAFNPSGGGGVSGNQDLYALRQVGTYALNPETGAITVQAPSWILNDIDTYLKGVEEMYNTDISFIAEILSVTGNLSSSEGWDISGIAKWASGNYNAIISNNALGGITLSIPTTGMPSVSAGAQSVGGALVGLAYQGQNNALNLFNAYLSQLGNVSVIQRPTITTTSGIPGLFNSVMTDYFLTINQQASSGNTGAAAVATQNTPVPYQTGTIFRVNPRIDIKTGLVRAQVDLQVVLKTGTRSLPQIVTVGNTIQSVPQDFPVLKGNQISGEVLLRDGDLIVVGGQINDSLIINANGLPGGSNDSPLGGPIGNLFGTRTAGKTAETYYFALRVAVNKRQ